MAAIPLTVSPFPIVPPVTQEKPEKRRERARTPSGDAVALAEQEESLAQTVGLQARPGGPDRALRSADPKVREATLEALQNLHQIPALQSLAQGFMRALGRVDLEVGEVVEAIAKDSALCVRILKMANSAAISPEQRIEDLATAVQMLGVVRVRKTAQVVITLRDANRVVEGFDWRHLWVHALATAAIAEELERRLRGEPDPQLYLAALLHDVGKIVLSTVATEDYRDILVAAWNEQGRLEDLERAQLGVDHREAGTIFARHNGLPEIVLASIAHHDRPEAAEQHRFEVALVALANHLSKAHGLGFSGSRLGEGDPEFGELSAWDVVEEARGRRPDGDALEAELAPFIVGLRTELRGMREEC